MSKFVPQELLESIEYDFTHYGGTAGVIPEPSTKAVNGFFRSMKSMTREVKGLMGEAKRLEQRAQDESIEEGDIDEILEQMDTMEEGATAYTSQMMQNIAVLCGAQWQEQDDNEDGYKNPPVLVGGTPSYTDLEDLPYRVFQIFAQWLIREIQPKRETPGTNTSPGVQPKP